MDDIVQALASVPTRIDVAVVGHAVRSALLATWGTPSPLPGAWFHRTAPAVLWDTPLDARAHMFDATSLIHVIVVANMDEGINELERAQRKARELVQGEANVTVIRVSLRNTRSLARAQDEVTRVCKAAHARLVDSAEKRIASALSTANFEDTAVGV